MYAVLIKGVCDGLSTSAEQKGHSLVQSHDGSLQSPSPPTEAWKPEPPKGHFKFRKMPKSPFWGHRRSREKKGLFGHVP